MKSNIESSIINFLQKRLALKISLLVLILLAIVLSVNSVTCVPTGSIGVATRFGRVTGETLDAGIHFKNPVDQIHKMNCRTQSYSYKTLCFSKDLQQVETQLNILFRLQFSDASRVFETIGENYFSQVLPRISDTLKQKIADYKAEEILDSRESIRKMVVALSQERLNGIVVVEDISFVNIDFSDEYERAIERKQIAHQESLKARYDLERAKTEAEQKVARANGEAEALKVKSEALKANKDIVLLEAIEKWDGKMPNTLVLGQETQTMFPIK
ncbi:MAG: prohibitin family protein [Opitutales bacterium]|nr:prohibitin family protein [Opitutales bacterium]